MQGDELRENVPMRSRHHVCAALAKMLVVSCWLHRWIVLGAERTEEGGRRHIWSLTPSCRVQYASSTQIAQSGGKSVPFFVVGPLTSQMGKRHHQCIGVAISHTWHVFGSEHCGHVTANFPLHKMLISGCHHAEYRDVLIFPHNDISNRREKLNNLLEYFVGVVKLAIYC